MNKVKLGALLEDVIRIRDTYKLNMDDRESLAEVANLIDKNMEKLVDEQ